MAKLGRQRGGDGGLADGNHQHHHHGDDDAVPERQQATGDYAVLQKLLEGRTLADVQDEARRLAAAADTMAANLDPAQVAAADPGRLQTRPFQCCGTPPSTLVIS